jgi:hypothetical protein
MVLHLSEQNAVQAARLVVIKRAFCCLALLACAGLARAATPALPNIPAYTTNVTQAPYNARGDGTTTNTTAIQTAINDVNARGGGTVKIPGPGVYLSGPLTLTDLRQLENLTILYGATYGDTKCSWHYISNLLGLGFMPSPAASGAGQLPPP